MKELSIAAPSGLTTPADPKSHHKSRFILFSESWLELQGFVGAGLELPITEGKFEDKYGSIGSSGTIKNCISAMKNVQQASTEFGDPKSLRASLIENPNILATAEAPSEIYTHTVWMGQRVHETSTKIVSGYTSVLDGLENLPPSEQVANLKAYLFDQTLGPIPLAKKMSDEVGELIKKLGKFEQKMNEYNEVFRQFTSSSSDMVAEVNNKIGELRVTIKDLEKSRDDAYKAWRDFTIAAVSSSVGCALIGGILAPFTGGASIAIGAVAGLAAGVALGVKAAENRAKYNQFCKLIQKESTDLRKKLRLRSDLGDFNLQMQRVGPAMSGFLANLQNVQGIWTQMNSDMLAIHNSISEDNVGSIPFLVRAKSNLAVDSWKDVDESAKQFTVGSLVDYTGLAFGEELPENMEQKKAA